ncbi:uncharacterized protein LOC124368852 [Homalodisca vitripennis]|uniref:uncharacterized protein LOC124368852 n=1 Tax=Homalodisca vitripennis TaxID=197043 RepID=UPI001EEAC906|nr:uncharacterized protein LOC124368852 [Homalodisca vitripennis]
MFSDADTVVLKGSPEIDWQLLATSLQKAGVKHLDFKKMKVYNDEETNTLMFDRCVKALSNVDSLEKLDICRCKSEFVERIAAVCRQLEYITTGSINGSGIDLSHFSTNLIQLKLKGEGNGLTITNVPALLNMHRLKELGSIFKIMPLGIIIIRV